MSDIVERLRSLNADFLHEEAADEIERLRAERGEAMADLELQRCCLAVVRKDRDRAMADGDRLREALNRIAARVDRLTGGLTYTEKATRDIARAALGEVTP